MLSPKLSWDLANPRWASELNPLLANPLNNVQILQNVSLNNGTTIINHGLGRMQQGWFLTDVQGAATIYRNANFNSTTLSLHSSAAVVVSIGVF